MGAMASQITSLATICSNVYSDADQRKHQSSVSLAFVRENVSIWLRHHEWRTFGVSYWSPYEGKNNRRLIESPLQYVSLNPVWIGNHMPSKMWDEITCPFPNFSSCNVEVWEWISNFISLIIMDVFTPPCGDLFSQWVPMIHLLYHWSNRILTIFQRKCLNI